MYQILRQTSFGILLTLALACGASPAENADSTDDESSITESQAGGVGTIHHCCHNPECRYGADYKTSDLYRWYQSGKKINVSCPVCGVGTRLSFVKSEGDRIGLQWSPITPTPVIPGGQVGSNWVDPETGDPIDLKSYLSKYGTDPANASQWVEHNKPNLGSTTGCTMR